MYVCYIDRRLRGINRRRRFRFRFVFVSCVLANGRGEAVWACERGLSVNAGPPNDEMYSSGRGFGFRVFAAICMILVLFINAICVCSFLGFLCF